MYFIFKVYNHETEIQVIESQDFRLVDSVIVAAIEHLKECGLRPKVFHRIPELNAKTLYAEEGAIFIIKGEMLSAEYFYKHAISII